MATYTQVPCAVCGRLPQEGAGVICANCISQLPSRTWGNPDAERLLELGQAVEPHLEAIIKALLFQQATCEIDELQEAEMAEAAIAAWMETNCDAAKNGGEDEVG